MKRVTLVSLGLLSAAATGQDPVDIQIRAATDPIRYTIETTSKSTTEREMLVDGEPAGGRGGFGGGGETSSTQNVVFDEGRDGAATWRVYRTATAKVTSPGRDGEPVERELEGGMLGERLFLVEDDRGLVVTRGAPDGEELPPFAVRDLPARTDFAGVLPDGPVAIGEDFEMPAEFVRVLGSLVHPVRPATAPGAFRRGGDAAGGRPGRGQGEAGGDETAPEARPRGRGQAGRGEAGRGDAGRDAAGRGGEGRRAAMAGAGRGAPIDPTLHLLANPKLEGKLVGKVTGLRDGIATIEFRGQRKGEGEGVVGEIGMGMRGRRGRQGAMPSGEGSVTIDVSGSLTVDVAQHRLVSLTVEGDSTSNSHLVSERGEREMELTTKRSGTFRVTLRAQAAPADDAADQKKDG